MMSGSFADEDVEAAVDDLEVDPDDVGLAEARADEDVESAAGDAGVLLAMVAVGSWLPQALAASITSAQAPATQRDRAFVKFTPESGLTGVSEGAGQEDKIIT